MNCQISLYRKVSGEILRTVTCDARHCTLHCKEGEDYIDGAYSGETFFVSPATGDVTQRPALNAPVPATPIKAGNGVYRVDGLPIPSRVTVDADVYHVDDGCIELSFDAPGTYLVRVEAFPFLPAEVRVEVD